MVLLYRVVYSADGWFEERGRPISIMIDMMFHSDPGCSGVWEVKVRSGRSGRELIRTKYTTCEDFVSSLSLPGAREP